jgi:hypothetical protein
MVERNVKKCKEEIFFYIFERRGGGVETVRGREGGGGKGKPKGRKYYTVDCMYLNV